MNTSVKSKLLSLYTKSWKRSAKYLHSLSLSQLANILGIHSDISTQSKRAHIKEALRVLYQTKKVNYIDYIDLLQACSFYKSLTEGKCVHTHVLKTGFIIDLELGNGLMIMYAKCGEPEDAYQVFDEMTERDVVTWSAMIGGFQQKGNDLNALRLFPRMLASGVKPNQYSFGSVLTAAAGLRHLNLGSQVFGNMIKVGYDKHPIAGGALVHMYAKCGAVEFARAVFDSLPEQSIYAATALLTGFVKCQRMEEASKLFWTLPKKNVVSWNAMIAGHAQNGLIRQTLELFWQMRLAGYVPNQSTYPPVLSACGNWAALGNGKHVHALVLKAMCTPDLFVGNALITMYAKCSSMQDACKLFERMPFKNVVTWNAVISGYAQNGEGKEALQFFEQMQNSQVKPNDVTMLCVLSACNHAGLVDEGCYYYHHIIEKYGVVPRAEHDACMVDLLGRSGRLNEADVFIKNISKEPTASLWKALLGACKLHGNTTLGQYAAEKVIESGEHHTSTYLLLAHIFAKAGRWDDVAKVRKLIKNGGVRRIPAFSWIEVKNQMHRFVIGDRTHPQTEEIYALLDKLHRQMKEAGYVPDQTLASYVEDK